jgi:hypothetical protein
MEPNTVIKWIECHPGLAGYVQAVGVIAGVAIALFGPPIARWLERWHQRRARAKSIVRFARGCLPSIQLLIERIDMASARLHNFHNLHAIDAGQWNELIKSTGIEIPGTCDAVMYNQNDDWVLPDLKFLRDLIGRARGYNSALWESAQQGHTAKDLSDMRMQVRCGLNDLRAEASGALATIEAM